MTNKLLVFVPTYNERENIEPLCQEIQKLGIPLDILFMDDHSTDGSDEILKRLCKENTNVKLVQREGKLGVGSAHKAGIAWAYDNGYQHLVTMDCDFTHPPRYIPEIIKKADEGFDIVLGSRYLETDSLPGWSLFRKSLTHTGHFLTSTLLGMKFDATGGFRYYRLTTVPKYAFDLVTSNGYSFFFESLYILCFNKFRIAEISISLPSRTYGHSKMTFKEMRTSLNLLFTTYFKTLFNREKFEIVEPLRLEKGQSPSKDEQGWESYWENKKTNAGGLLYDAIAAFYRKFIIRRSLNWFTGKHFQPGAQILHAGCGSGQVDSDIRNRFSITGLDFSVNALSFYKKTNKDLCRTLYGSIFEIPLESETVDGIYNLGVMEHFSPNEISSILKEFHRVLKPKGKMVIFWPPEFGLSVIFFKVLKFIFVHFLGKKDVKFHPDEITRVQSKSHVVDLFTSSGFRVLEYYFGPKDLFTYSVICVEKQAETATQPWSASQISQKPQISTTPLTVQDREFSI